PYLWETPKVRPGEPLPKSEPIDWKQVFGDDHPVEIEVGFGKGLFLLNAAMACPGVNFFGVEIMRKYQLFTATRMARRKLTALPPPTSEDYLTNFERKARLKGTPVNRGLYRKR